MVNKVKQKQVIAPGTVQERLNQKILVPAGVLGKASTGSGWVVDAADSLPLATLPASKTGSILLIPVPNLKVGNKITAFGLSGQIESAGGAVTLDCELRKVTAAAADVTDASVASMTQLAVTADTAVTTTNASKTLSSPEVVSENSSYYILVTGTTAASTDIGVIAAIITVTEQ